MFVLLSFPRLGGCVSWRRGVNWDDDVRVGDDGLGLATLRSSSDVLLLMILCYFRGLYL